MLAEIEALPLVSRWVHFTSVIVAVGGTAFLRLVLLPAARTALSDDAHASLRSVLIRRWAWVLHATIALIILSGTYNVILKLPAHAPVEGEPPLYHILLGVKLILAGVIFAIAFVLTGRSPGTESIRKQASKWLAVNLFLAAIVVAMANVMKSIPATVGG